jgi:hypothetical protein
LTKKSCGLILSHRDVLDVESPCVPFDGHAGQRVSELRSAVATHSIGSAINRKNTAQMTMVAAEEKIQGKHESLHMHSL